MQLSLFRKPIYKSLNIIGIILAVLFLGFALFGLLSIVFLFFLFILWFSIITWGSFNISSGIYLSTFNGIVTNEFKIALTFDDGPHQNTLAVLDLLNKFKAKATFFITGENAEKHPDIVKKMQESGHQIGNHTYSHSEKFPFFSSKIMVEEIAKTSIIIKKLTGTKPKTFRPPFGITNPRVAKSIKKLNLDAIGWSVRSLDTVTNNPEKVIRRIIKKTKPGSIILLHEYTVHSAFVLEQILKYFSEQGYSFESVDELKCEKFVKKE